MPQFRENIIIEGLYWLHHISAALFVIYFVVHIFFLIIPANRYLIKSMFTGKINKKDVIKKHPEWKI